MNIGFDAKRAFMNRAGLGNFSRNTIRSLSAFFPVHTYFLFTPAISPDVFSPPAKANVVMPGKLWPKMLRPLWRTYRIACRARQEKLDIYHGLSQELPSGIEKTNIRTTVTIHDLIFLRFPELYRPADRKIYLQKIKHACAVAGKIIAISEQTKTDLQHFLSVKEDRIEVLYQPVDPLFFGEVEEEDLFLLKKKYDLPEHFILTVGTIERRKNLGLILNALADRKIDLPLVVIGKPTKYMQTLEPAIRQMKDRIFFFHGISNRELNLFYRLADVMVYPSIFEGFGLPVAEAQACGCPVITSNLSSLPEAGGDGAVYVHPERTDELVSAILNITMDESFRRDMQKKGLKNAQRFLPEKYAGSLMKIYQEI